LERLKLMGAAHPTRGNLNMKNYKYEVKEPTGNVHFEYRLDAVKYAMSKGIDTIYRFYLDARGFWNGCEEEIHI
jgi:hypothetical protein